MGMEVKEYAKIYLNAILEIMEDKPPFVIAPGVHLILVFVLFHQIAGYLFSSVEVKPIFEPKVLFIARLNELSPGTFLLYFRADDGLTLLSYALMHGVMYGYYIYVGVYAYYRHAKAQWVARNKHIFRKINEMLNILFTFFWWVFLTPYVEINCSIISCNANSFLTTMKTEEQCANISVIFPILGYVGLILACITGIITIVFYRSHEFNEKDALRRKFRPITLVIFACRVAVAFVYYKNIVSLLWLKELIMNLISALLVIDIVMYRPYTNKFMYKVYIAGVATFLVSMACFSIFLETKLIPENQLAYSIIMLSPLLGAALIGHQNAEYEKIMRIDANTFHKYFDLMDVYLEEVFQNIDCFKRNEEANFRLMEIITVHQAACKNMICRCKETTFKGGKDSQILKEEVLRLIESMFLWSLKQKEIMKSLPHYEHMSLKYISFIAKYRNNPVKAYFELKSLMSQQRRQMSFYFEAIQEILAKRIEGQIVANQLNSYATNQMHMGLFTSAVGGVDEDANLKLNVSDFIFSDSVKEAVLPEITRFVEMKITLYETMCKGYESLLKLSYDLSRLTNKAKQIEETLVGFFGQDLSFSTIFSIKSFNKNVFILKIFAIYERLVMSRIDISSKYEEVIKEMKKRDALGNNLTFNTENILRGKIQTVIISLASQKGKLIRNAGASGLKLDAFFGYVSSDVIAATASVGAASSAVSPNSLTHVTQLMPAFLGEIHEALVQNYLVRGQSRFVKGSNYTFGQDNKGFIMPLSVSIENIFGIKDDFHLYASLLLLENHKEFILFNDTGQILGISSAIFKNLFHPMMSSRKSLTFATSTQIIGKKKQMESYSKSAFEVYKKLNFFMIMPEILSVIGKPIKESSFVPTKTTATSSTHRGNEEMSSIETISSNMTGMIRVPSRIAQIQRHFKNTQGNASELSRSPSISSYHTTVHETNKDYDVFDAYENFYRNNKKNWSRENLFSSTKVKFDILQQNLVYFKEKKTQRTSYYVMQINEREEIVLEKVEQRNSNALLQGQSFNINNNNGISLQHIQQQSLGQIPHSTSILKRDETHNNNNKPTIMSFNGSLIDYDSTTALGNNVGGHSQNGVFTSNSSLSKVHSRRGSRQFNSFQNSQSHLINNNSTHNNLNNNTSQRVLLQDYSMQKETPRGIGESRTLQTEEDQFYSSHFQLQPQQQQHYTLNGLQNIETLQTTITQQNNLNFSTAHDHRKKENSITSSTLLLTDRMLGGQHQPQQQQQQKPLGSERSLFNQLEVLNVHLNETSEPMNLNNNNINYNSNNNSPQLNSISQSHAFNNNSQVMMINPKQPLHLNNLENSPQLSASIISNAQNLNIKHTFDIRKSHSHNRSPKNHNAQEVFQQQLQYQKQQSEKQQSPHNHSHQHHHRSNNRGHSNSRDDKHQDQFLAHTNEDEQPSQRFTNAMDVSLNSVTGAPHKSPRHHHHHHHHHQANRHNQHANQGGRSAFSPTHVAGAAANTTGTEVRKSNPKHFWEVIKNTISNSQLKISNPQISRMLYQSRPTVDSYQMELDSHHMHNLTPSDNLSESDSDTTGAANEDSQSVRDAASRYGGARSTLNRTVGGKSLGRTIRGGNDDQGAAAAIAASQGSSTKKVDKTNARFLMDIAHSKRTPRFFKKLKIFFVMMIMIFVGLEIIFHYGIIKQYSNLNDIMRYEQQIILENSEYQLQAIHAINYEAVEIGLVTSDTQSTLLTDIEAQIQMIKTSYMNAFPSRLQSNYEYASDDQLNLFYNLQIFSHLQQQNEDRKFTELKLMNADSISQYLYYDTASTSTTASAQRDTDKFLYLVFNSHTNHESDLARALFSEQEMDDMHSQLETRQLIFIGSFLFLFIVLISCFFPILTDINSYQQRLLVLVTRMSIGECAGEAFRLINLAKCLNLSTDMWLQKSFSSIEKENMKLNSSTNQTVSVVKAKTPTLGPIDPLKQSQRLAQSSQLSQGKSKVKSNNNNNNMNQSMRHLKTPVHSLIQVQHIPALKKIIFFTMLSLVSCSYFAIFLGIIAEYASSAHTYDNFLDFITKSIPHFTNIALDWQALACYDAFSNTAVTMPTSIPSYAAVYSKLDRQEFLDSYETSKKAINEFMLYFPKKLDEFTGASSTVKEQLNSLYSSDICESYADECGSLTSLDAGFYSKGISGLISSYLSLYKNFDVILQNVDANTNASTAAVIEEARGDYFASKEVEGMLLKEFQVSVKFTQKLVAITLAAFDDANAALENAYELYLIFFGFFILTAFILMGTIFYSSNVALLGNANFGLTCLTLDKIADDSTLQMLKSVRKM